MRRGSSLDNCSKCTTGCTANLVVAVQAIGCCGAPTNKLQYGNLGVSRRSKVCVQNIRGGMV